MSSLAVTGDAKATRTFDIEESKYFGLEKANEILKEQMKTLTRTCEATHMENAMLADYLTRICQNNTLEEIDEEFSQVTKQNGKGKKSNSKNPSKPPEVLQYDMKFYIASSEVDSLMKDIEATKRTAQKNVELLKALMEETEIRTQELKREAYELRRDVVVGAENSRTGKTMAEPLLRWLEEKLTRKDALASKLLMKNHALKTAIRKVRQQLRAKDDAGEDLAYIDFHQMQIENQQYVARIEQTTAELIALKRTASHSIARLSALKEALAEQEELSVRLKAENVEKTERLKELSEQVHLVAKQHERALREALAASAHADPLTSATLAPNVRDNVELRNKEMLLQSEVKKLQRKTQIARNAWRTMRARLRQIDQQEQALAVTGANGGLMLPNINSNHNNEDDGEDDNENIEKFLQEEGGEAGFTAADVQNNQEHHEQQNVDAGATAATALPAEGEAV